MRDVSRQLPSAAGLFLAHAIMDDDGDKASEYRRQAAVCLEVSERMLRVEDRALMLQLAQQWLELAREVAANGD